MNHDTIIQTVIVATKTLTLLLGGTITVLSYKAYRRTGARSLGALATGFGVIAIGSLLAGTAWLLFGSALLTSAAIESVLITIGFVVIVYSLYITEQ